MIRRLLRAVLPASLVVLAQRLRADMRRAAFPRRVVRHRYGGHEFTLVIADDVGAGWYDGDWPEPPEFAVLRRGRLRPGAKVFDLGAHQGVVALMLARTVGPGGRVVAVEGASFNAALARENRDRNGASNLEVLHAIVGDEATRVRFNPATGHVTRAAAFGEGAPIVTVDGLAERFGRPDVVYLDIEGFEATALRGARATLAAGRTDFFVEVHVELLAGHGASAAEVLAHFPASAWDLFVQDREDAPFRPAKAAEVPATRFFLVALRRPAPDAA